MTKLHLRHPIFLLILLNTTQTATSAYTPKSSPLRYLSFLICASISYLALSTYHDYIVTTGYTGRTLAAALTTLLSFIFDRLIYRGWNYEEDASSFETPGGRKLTRWEFGDRLSSSARYCGNEKEVANVPPFDTRDVKFVPERSEFVAGHFLWCVGLYFLNTVGTMMLKVQGDSLALISEENVSFFARLEDVSLAEVVVRAKISIGWWLIQFAYLNFYYSIGALMAAATSKENVRFWPPIFGGVESAFTVRAFWGKFWHQCIRLNLSGIAEFIAHDVLRLSRGTLVARYLKVLLSFFYSGVMHIVGDYGGDVSWGQSGAIRFFSTQALGIMLEDGVQEVWRRMFGGSGEGQTWRKVVGYVWVLGFLVWSTPAWCFPVARTMKGEDVALLPTAWWPVVRGIWG